MSNPSGKLIILGIVGVALVAAATSWSFRYFATHRAVRFWGAGGAQCIRDAPTVHLFENRRLPNGTFSFDAVDSRFDVANGRDISHAPGLVHLRNALLEDHSFHWPAVYMRPDSWGWAIVFRDADHEPTILLFTRNWDYVDSPNYGYMLSCEPISSGLRKFVEKLPPESSPPAR